MKKITALIMIAILLTSLMACSQDQENPGEISTGDVSTGDVSAGTAGSELQATLVGTWTADIDMGEIGVTLSMVFEADGSCVFNGYENTMYGNYEISGENVLLRFYKGIGEGTEYEATAEDNKIGTYDASTGILTVQYESPAYAGIVWNFQKTA